MKIFRGVRTSSGCTVTVDDKPLSLCTEIVNHSPDAFEWGYGGSGPAQLALAILMECFQNPEQAERLHHGFKWKVIAAIQSDVWQMTDDEVIQALDKIELERGG